MEFKRTYLGDSVYIENIGHMLKLFTDNGMDTSNVIFLEPEVQIALVQYIERLVANES